MIKELIEKWTCKHDWKEPYQVNLYRSKNGKTKRCKSMIIYVCKKCGKIKKIYV